MDLEKLDGGGMSGGKRPGRVVKRRNVASFGISGTSSSSPPPPAASGGDPEAMGLLAAVVAEDDTLHNEAGLDHPDRASSSSSSPPTTLPRDRERDREWERENDRDRDRGGGGRQKQGQTHQDKRGAARERHKVEEEEDEGQATEAQLTVNMWARRGGSAQLWLAPPSPYSSPNPKPKPTLPVPPSPSDNPEQKKPVAVKGRTGMLMHLLLSPPGTPTTPRGEAGGAADAAAAAAATLRCHSDDDDDDDDDDGENFGTNPSKREQGGVDGGGEAETDGGGREGGGDAFLDSLLGVGGRACLVAVFTCWRNAAASAIIWRLASAAEARMPFASFRTLRRSVRAWRRFANRCISASISVARTIIYEIAPAKRFAASKHCLDFLSDHAKERSTRRTILVTRGAYATKAKIVSAIGRWRERAQATINIRDQRTRRDASLCALTALTCLKALKLNCLERKKRRRVLMMAGASGLRNDSPRHDGQGWDEDDDEEEEKGVGFGSGRLRRGSSNHPNVSRARGSEHAARVGLAMSRGGVLRAGGWGGGGGDKLAVEDLAMPTTSLSARHVLSPSSEMMCQLAADVPSRVRDNHHHHHRQQQQQHLQQQQKHHHHHHQQQHHQHLKSSPPSPHPYYSGRMIGGGAGLKISPVPRHDSKLGSAAHLPISLPSPSSSPSPSSPSRGSHHYGGAVWGENREEGEVDEAMLGLEEFRSSILLAGSSARGCQIE